MKLFFLLIFSTFITNAQTITGKWVTFDDNTGQKKGVVEIFEKDNKYYGKIIKSFTSDENAICEKCVGNKKNQPIIGLQIIEDLKLKKDIYEGGTILDPENGETYKCYIEIVNSNKIKVRGYIGFALLGRTQYWEKL